MAFHSVESMLRAARMQSLSLADAICRNDLAESGLTEESSRRQMAQLWSVMQETSKNYCASDRSNSGLIGGDAGKVRAAYEQGLLMGDSFLNTVIEEAVKTAECNACMKRIVAAPTAGSCGVLPAVLIALSQTQALEENAILDALYISAGFGQIVAHRASISGAEGGCQAEIGTASAMAAAALVSLRGGSNEQCATAFSIALSNLLGLVCDPVAGLVEVPCVHRNVIGAVNAVSAANLALAGITHHIPPDEVIDAMREVGDQMHADLRETGIGGLAGTPTAKLITERLQHKKF